MSGVLGASQGGAGHLVNNQATYDGATRAVRLGTIQEWVEHLVNNQAMYGGAIRA